MSYIGNEPIVSATRTVTEVTATAGQTVFTANGGYTVGFLDVFINGSKLTSADFTATDGSTVTLTEAAQVNDIVRLEALGTFQAANAVLLTGNSNLTGNLNVSGNLGVGTTSPSAQLQLNKSGTGDYTAMRLSNSGASGRTYEIGLGGNTAAAGYANTLYFYDSNAGAIRMSIDSSGRVTQPFQPMAAVRRVSQDPSTTGNVVVFATTDVNVGSVYNTSNGRFTAPVAGKYFLGAFIIAKNNNSFASFEFYKNGSLQSPTPYSGGNSVPYWGVAGYYIFDLAANDYMEIRTTSSYAYSNANDTNNGAIFYLLG